MPNGFSGHAARRYLDDVAQAREQAVSVTRDMPSGSPPAPRPRPLPFSSDSAGSGQFSTGQGSSDNIVVSQADYDALAYKLYQIDERVSDCLYQCAKQVEEMCDTIFIMPVVGPRCKHIAGGVVECLGQLRALTDDVGASAKKFAAEIMEIG